MPHIGENLSRAFRAAFRADMIAGQDRELFEDALVTDVLSLEPAPSVAPQAPTLLPSFYIDNDPTPIRASDRLSRAIDAMRALGVDTETIMREFETFYAQREQDMLDMDHRAGLRPLIPPSGGSNVVPPPTSPMPALLPVNSRRRIVM